MEPVERSIDLKGWRQQFFPVEYPFPVEDLIHSEGIAAPIRFKYPYIRVCDVSNVAAKLVGEECSPICVITENYEKYHFGGKYGGELYSGLILPVVPEKEYQLQARYQAGQKLILWNSPDLDMLSKIRFGFIAPIRHIGAALNVPPAQGVGIPFFVPNNCCIKGFSIMAKFAGAGLWSALLFQMAEHLTYHYDEPVGDGGYYPPIIQAAQDQVGDYYSTTQEISPAYIAGGMTSAFGACGRWLMFYIQNQSIIDPFTIENLFINFY